MLFWFPELFVTAPWIFAPTDTLRCCDFYFSFVLFISNVSWLSLNSKYPTGCVAFKHDTSPTADWQLLHHFPLIIRAAFHPHCLIFDHWNICYISARLLNRSLWRGLQGLRRIFSNTWKNRNVLVHFVGNNLSLKICFSITLSMYPKKSDMIKLHRKHDGIWLIVQSVIRRVWC